MKKRIIATLLLLPIFTAVSLLAAYNLHILLSGGAAFSWRPSALFNAVVQIPSVRLFFALFVLLSLVFLIFCLFSGSEAYHTGSSRIIPEVSIPSVPCASSILKKNRKAKKKAYPAVFFLAGRAATSAF